MHSIPLKGSSELLNSRLMSKVKNDAGVVKHIWTETVNNHWICASYGGSLRNLIHVHDRTLLGIFCLNLVSSVQYLGEVPIQKV